MADRGMTSALMAVAARLSTVQPRVGALRSSAPCRMGMATVSTVLGIVDTVTGDNIVAKSLSAPPMSIATFQSGGSGLVTDITKEATHICLIDGHVVPTETVLGDAHAATIPVSTNLLGRVVSPLGDPIDGRGDVQHTTGLTRRQPLMPASPGIVERGPVSSSFPTGVKSIDTFFPVLRGSSNVVVGERGTGKRALVETILANIARANREALDADIDAPPVVCVYVSIGHPVGGVQDLVQRLEASGALPYTVVVAAPLSGHAGAAYLAPFAGAAIGEYFRDTGRHAVVIYDDLTSHHTAARRVARLSWAKTGATPSGHAGLFDRCAQLSPERGGGSMTALALLDSVPSGPAYTQLEHVKGREMVANVASLADNRIALSRTAVKAGSLMPVDFEDLTARPGHAAQGPALRYYTNRTREVLGEVRETARGAALAHRIGVVLESESDSILDLHTKMRTLLLPTQSLLSTIADARASGTDVAADDVSRLGLEGLQYIRVEGAASGTAAGQGSSTGGDASGEARSAESATLAAVTSILAAREAAKGPGNDGLKGQAGKVASMGGTGSVRRYSSTPLSHQKAPSGSGSGKAPLESRIESLKGKMDREQLRTLQAVQEARRAPRRKAGMSAAEAYFAAQKAGASAEAAVAAAAAAAEKSGASQADASADAQTGPQETTQEKQYDSIFDVPDEEPGQAGQDNAGASGAARGPGGPSPAKPAWWGAMSGKPPGSRGYSTTVGRWNEHGPQAPPKASKTNVRMPFTAPTGRTPPAALFTLPKLEPSRADDVTEPWHAWQWKEGPQAGDPARTLLTLFILSHGYVASVPLPYLLSYERGLYELVAALPAPAPGQGQGEHMGVEELVTASLSRGMLHTPVASVRAGYVTLLDAAVVADVPEAMVVAAQPTMEDSLRQASLAVIRAAAEQAAREARQAAVAAAAREAAAREAKARSGGSTLANGGSGSGGSWTDMFTRGTWRVFAPGNKPPASKEAEAAKAGPAVAPVVPVVDDGAAAPKSSAASPEAAAIVQPQAPPAVALEGLRPHLRTGGTDLMSLPPVWQALHVAVAEYTRGFLGLPAEQPSLELARDEQPMA